MGFHFAHRPEAVQADYGRSGIVYSGFPSPSQPSHVSQCQDPFYLPNLRPAAVGAHKSAVVPGRSAQGSVRPLLDAVSSIYSLHQRAILDRGFAFFHEPLTYWQGVRRSEEEFRGEECKVCTEVREAQMSQMNMTDFNVRRLGWRTYKGAGAGAGGRRQDDQEDSDGGYCW
ncbi:hypothetical protein DL769_001467 [Monosporascus sp. CRB-8-3]|nr:hypothetical protein DL769_001467 [Monosporascus sp. CRB-8-3]